MTRTVGYPFERDVAMSAAGIRLICCAMYRPAYGVFAVEQSTWISLGFAWELGYTIAVPAVVFSLGGAYLDKLLGMTPLFLLLGIAVSLAISAAGAYGKMKRFLRQMPKDPPLKPKPEEIDAAESLDLHDAFRPKS